MSNKENTIQEIIISDVHIKSYYYNERPNYNKKKSNVMIQQIICVSLNGI